MRRLSEHHVYKQWNTYIKTPKNPSFFFWKNKEYLKEVLSSIEFIRTHFDFEIPHTHVEYHNSGYQIIQDEVHWEPLNLLTCSIDTLKNIHNKVTKNYWLRKKYGKALDFYGTDAFLAPHIMHNILWTQTIIDFGLLSKHARKRYYALSYLFVHIQYRAFMSVYICRVGRMSA